MSANTPKFRPAHLLLIASIVLFGSVSASAPASAQPLDFKFSVRSFASWIQGLGSWFQGTEASVQARKADGPKAGTCIDPNGKPKPCESTEYAPPGARHEAGRTAPRN